MVSSTIFLPPCREGGAVLVCADKDLGQFYQSPGEFKSVIIDFLKSLQNFAKKPQILICPASYIFESGWYSRAAVMMAGVKFFQIF